MAPKAKSCAPLQSDSVAEFVSSLEATNFIGGVKCCGCETNFKSPKGLRDHLKKHGVEGAAVQKLVQFRTQLEKDQRALPDVSPALTDLEKSRIEPIPGGDHRAVRCLGCGHYTPKSELVYHFCKRAKHKDERLDKRIVSLWQSVKDWWAIKNGRSPAKWRGFETLFGASVPSGNAASSANAPPPSIQDRRAQIHRTNAHIQLSFCFSVGINASRLIWAFVL